MRETRVAVFVHLVWGTWDRLPLLVGEHEREVYRCIEETCRASGVEVLALGGVSDHVHLVVRLPATLAVATLMKQIKGTSSHLATHALARSQFFKWQGGYGAFSASAKGLPALCAYVRNQKEHNRLGTLIAAYEPVTTYAHATMYSESDAASS